MHPVATGAHVILPVVTMSRWQANLLLLVAGATWGMGFVAQASAMDNIGPYLFIGLRFLTASIVVLPFALREARTHSLATASANTQGGNDTTWLSLSMQDIGKFSLIGLSLFAGMAAQQVGLLTTSVTNSGFLTGLYVVFTPFLGILLFRNRPHPVTWIAAVLSFTGIFYLAGGNLAQLVVGDLLTILSAVFWALQVVLIARFVGQSGRPLALSLVQFVVTAALALFIALFFEPVVWSSILDAAPQILYAGIFASGLAFTLQVLGQRYTSAPQAAIFLSSEAPFAAMFAYLWMDERIATIGFIGCALIFLAMLTVELVPLWLNRASRAQASGRKAQGEH